MVLAVTVSMASSATGSGRCSGTVAGSRRSLHPAMGLLARGQRTRSRFARQRGSVWWVRWTRGDENRHSPPRSQDLVPCHGVARVCLGARLAWHGHRARQGEMGPPLPVPANGQDTGTRRWGSARGPRPCCSSSPGCRCWCVAALPRRRVCGTRLQQLPARPGPFPGVVILPSACRPRYDGSRSNPGAQESREDHTRRGKRLGGPRRTFVSLS